MSVRPSARPFDSEHNVISLLALVGRNKKLKMKFLLFIYINTKWNFKINVFS
jgi:hypothetical protein